MINDNAFEKMNNALPQAENESKTKESLKRKPKLTFVKNDNAPVQ